MSGRMREDHGTAHPRSDSETCSIGSYDNQSVEEKAGRHAGTVRLVAATKTVTVEHIAEGVRAGLSILGESCTSRTS